MKRYVSQVLLFAILVALPVAEAQEQEATSSSAVPVKGTLEATGSVELLITIYDRPTRGHELYSVTTTMPVEHNMYFDMINVPDGVFHGRQTVYIEVATASAPEVALVAQSAWACVLCLSGTYSQLLEYMVFASLLFYVLTACALFCGACECNALARASGQSQRLVERQR